MSSCCARKDHKCLALSLGYTFQQRITQLVNKHIPKEHRLDMGLAASWQPMVFSDSQREQKTVYCTPLCAFSMCSPELAKKRLHWMNNDPDKAIKMANWFSRNMEIAQELSARLDKDSKANRQDKLDADNYIMFIHSAHGELELM